MSSSHSAVLSRWAGRRARRKLLGQIRLVNILSGDTCSPLGLEEFEIYLAFREHSLENLQFIVWYHDYRGRFFALSSEQQAFSPSPLSYAAQQSPLPTPDRYKSVPPSPATSSTQWALSPSSASSSSWAPWSPITPPPVALRDQPFRAETLSIVATFLRQNAKKELTLDADVRDEVLRGLERSTHPDVFMPAYSRIYDLVDASSVPNFVSTAAANINLPKQIYWYSIGITVTLISWIIALCTIYFIPDVPRSRRCIRLASVPFAVLGSMQIYSAWRGFCSQVFGRSARQLHAWELVDPAEAGVAFELTTPPIAPIAKPPPLHAIMELAATTSRGDVAPFLNGSAEILPSSSSFAPGPSTLSSMPSSTWDDPESNGPKIAISENVPRRSQRAGYRKPAVYGPEKVVDDARVRAYHQGLIRDMLWAGFCWGFLWTVLVVGVPGRRP
ncbi:hypothetical protein BDV93DRAFT_523956 [Ceratobasidium sp. AG-I]|nr:hypothetical protein BDV93DRAFT_523956 [Ceratobasidium sp. AG-I]